MSEKFNLTYFSPKVEKRKSAIDGRGLFARESISSGEVVVVKGGYVLTRAQPVRLAHYWGVGDPDYRRPVHRSKRRGGSERAA